jgi:transposase
MEIDTIGIDLGKTVFHLVGLDKKGEIVIRKKFTRSQLLHLTANLRVRLIGMEACGGAHFLGRALREQGHDVRLMPAPIHQAIRKDEQERLYRYGGHRRSGGAAEDALCADQKRGAAGSAVIPSRP